MLLITLSFNRCRTWTEWELHMILTMHGILVLLDRKLGFERWCWLVTVFVTEGKFFILICLIDFAKSYNNASDKIGMSCWQKLSGKSLFCIVFPMQTISWNDNEICGHLLSSQRWTLCMLWIPFVTGSLTVQHTQNPCSCKNITMIKTSQKIWLLIEPFKIKMNSSYNNKNAQLMYGNNLEQNTNRQVTVYTLICAFTCVPHFFVVVRMLKLMPQ